MAPWKERPTTKIEFTTTDVARYLSNPCKTITPHNVRYWSKKFKNYVKPKRGRRGVRKYCQKDIEVLIIVRNMIAYKNMSTSTVLEFLSQTKAPK